MGVVTVDPTLLVDNLIDMQDDTRYEHMSITGIYKIGKLRLYALVIDTLDGTGLRYGHMMDENTVVFSTDDLSDYIEELTESIQEEIASDISAEKQADTLTSDIVADYFGNDMLYGEIEDESEAFMALSGDSVSTNKHVMLSGFIQEAIEESVRVLTGGYREISMNTLTI